MPAYVMSVERNVASVVVGFVGSAVNPWARLRGAGLMRLGMEAPRKFVVLVPGWELR